MALLCWISAVVMGGTGCSEKQPAPSVKPSPVTLQNLDLSLPGSDPLVRGRSLLSQQRYREAISAYEEARERYPGSAEVCEGLGRIHMAFGYLDRAAELALSRD